MASPAPTFQPTFQPTFTEDLADRIASNDPNYNIMKQKIGNSGKCATILGVIILVAAVALSILGLSLCCAGILGGIAPLFISLPLFFLGYNTRRVGSNIKEIAQNPKTCADLGGFGNMNKEKLKIQIKKGTFGLDCLIDNAVEKLPTPERIAEFRL